MAPRATVTTTPPVGLAYVPRFLTEVEERELLAQLAPLPFHAVVMRGTPARRTVAHFGLGYGYEARTLEPAPPLPDFLLDLRARAAALGGLQPDTLVQVLVARYPPGAGIGWHRDAPTFGPTVVGVSLGAEAVLRFRRRTAAGWETFRLPVEPRSAYVLAGPARGVWQHGVAPGEGLRFSVTYRTLRRAREHYSP